MPLQSRINMYIDSANLHKSAKGLGFEIDYKRLRIWLSQKYNINKFYLFIGYMEQNLKTYEYLKGCGFNIIFKHTLFIGNSTKGNCDAELVLKIVSDYYEKSFSKCFLITGDGDFGCVVEFLRDRGVFSAPDERNCSFLLKNKNIEITFLNHHYSKFSIKSKL